MAKNDKCNNFAYKKLAGRGKKEKGKEKNN